MADLSNLKISETYGRVLQKDPDTGALQDLTGTKPSIITFDRTLLKYVDGNEASGFVLTSDASGKASWAAAGGGGADIYWSADTTSDDVKYIRVSGNTTGAKIGGNLDVTGDTHTSNLVLSPNGSITPNTNNTSIFFRNKLPGTGTASQEWMEIGDDKIHLNIEGNAYLSLTPNDMTFNTALDSVEYKWKQEGSWSNVLAAKVKEANHLFFLQTNVAVGKNSSNQNWPTTDGLQNSTPDGALKVWGDVTIAPGSGQTGNLGVSGNTDVKGYVSADTGVYSYNIFTNNITTTATSTDTLQIQSNQIDISSHGGSVEYLRIMDDKINFHIDGSEAVSFNKTNGYYMFNVGGQDLDFKIDGPTGEDVFHADVGDNRIRIMHHLTVGSSDNIPNITLDNYGLSVTGSSLFYPGTASTNCINAPGPISADTITGETIISTYGAIYSANTNLLDIFQVASAATETSYWSADTTPSEGVKYVRLSGNTTSAKIGGGLEISGKTIVGGNLYGPPDNHLDAYSDKSIRFQLDRDQDDTGDVNFAVYDSNAKPVCIFDINGQISARTQTIAENMGISGTTTLKGDFLGRGGKFQFSYEDASPGYIVGASENDAIIFGIGTMDPEHPLHVMGNMKTTGALYLDETQKVIFNSNGNETSFIQGISNNLRLDADDDILLYPDDDIKIGVGTTQYAYFYGNEKEFHISGDIYASDYLSGTSITGETLELKTHAGITGNTFLGGGLGVSGDTYITGPLSADTMSGRTLTLKENLGVSGTTTLTAGGTTFGPRPNIYFFANCDSQTFSPATDGSFPSTNTTDVSFSETLNSHAAVYSLSSDELTIARAGLYKITYNVTLEGGADGTTSNRTGGGIALLRKPSGGSYAVVDGTESYVYCRIANIERNTGTISIIYNVTANDVFKIIFIRTGAQTSGSKLGTITAGTAWTVEAVS